MDVSLDTQVNILLYSHAKKKFLPNSYMELNGKDGLKTGGFR
jgi:hypothetical protein